MCADTSTSGSQIDWGFTTVPQTALNGNQLPYNSASFPSASRELTTGTLQGEDASAAARC